MNPPKSHWSLVYYQHPENSRHDVKISEGADSALTAAGWRVIGHHMYTEPLLEAGYVAGTRYVFALPDRDGTGHLDISHSGKMRCSLYHEPAVSADRAHEDADRDADARRAQAADEAHDAYMTRDRYYRR